MRITLNQVEIEQAIEDFILEQVSVPEDMRIDIDLKATRGDEGYQAFIDIVDQNAPTGGVDRSVDPRVEPVKGAETLDIAKKVIAAKEQAEQPRRRGRPAGSKNKPKDGTDNAEVETKVEEASVPVTKEVDPEPVTTQEVVQEPVATQEETTPAVEAPEAPAEPEAEPVKETAAEVITDHSDHVVNEQIADPDPEPVSEEPKAPTKSLFAGLAKPTN